MLMASSSSTCITSSEGPESTDIDSEQTQQESASILNVLRAPTPADISMENTNVLIINILTPTCMSVGKSLKHFWCKNEA